MPIATTDPATGQTLKTFPPLTGGEIEARVARARAAFEKLRRTPVVERAALVARVGDILHAKREELGRLATLEMGKLYRAAVDEVEKCALGCRYYAENAERLLRDEEIATTGDTRDLVSYQPLGVILAVMPWNFPFWQVIRFAAPAVAAGNVGLLKHSSNVPQCALALEDVFRRAGAPEGIFQTLLIGPEEVDAIIADPRLAAVTLTGSDRAGRHVAATAGQHIKKTVLELGGSDAFIVMPSADLDQAVAVGVKARMVNNGQSCIAAKRFIVDESVYDEYQARFVKAVAGLRVGDPMADDTQLGPLATAGIRDGLADQVRRSLASGARVLTGGRPLDGPGFFYAPTVLADVPADSPAAQEELFGPVASLFRARGIDAAIELANASRFGLGASAWTQDPAEIDRFTEELEAGMVFINGMVASEPGLPFGGVKQSGYGRELGVPGLREFVNIKTVKIRNLARR